MSVLPFISVIVPSYGRSEVLRQTVESLMRQGYERHEIIVVEQSEHEDPALNELSRRFPDRLKLLRASPLGSPRARNLGARHAKGDVILSCDDDILAEPGLLKAHAARYADPKVGAVAGRVLTREDKPLHRIRKVGKVNPYTGWIISNFNADFPCEVDHAQGSNVSFRREAFEAVGGFDPAFTALGHFEETDLCLRLKRAGWKIVFEPKAVVHHLQHPSGGNRPKSFRERTFWHFHNYALLWQRHFCKLCLPLFLALMAAKATGYALRERDAVLLPVALVALTKGFLRTLTPPKLYC